MLPRVESGAELLARLTNKPSLCGLEDTLFLEGPRNTDVIEIAGERSTGKTLLLSRILARCILPRYYLTDRIPACNATAMLINTDHHFQVTKLIESMNDVIETAAAVSGTVLPGDKDRDKMAVIQNSLRNLHVIDCYDSEQLSLMLCTLDEMFLENAEIALLAIDSITAYYWQDSEDNVMAIDSYVRKLLKVVRMHTSKHNVVTIYTRLCECGNAKRSTSRISYNPDYKVHLRETPDTLAPFLCTVETIQTVREICYSISSNGVKWEMDKGHR